MIGNKKVPKLLTGINAMLVNSVIAIFSQSRKNFYLLQTIMMHFQGCTPVKRHKFPELFYSIFRKLSQKMIKTEILHCKKYNFRFLGDLSHKKYSELDILIVRDFCTILSFFRYVEKCEFYHEFDS